MIVPSLGATLGQIVLSRMNASKEKTHENQLVALVQAAQEVGHFLERASRVLAQIEPMLPKPVAPAMESFTYPDVDRIVRAAQATVRGEDAPAGAPEFWRTA